MLHSPIPASCSVQRVSVGSLELPECRPRFTSGTEFTQFGFHPLAGPTLAVGPGRRSLASAHWTERARGTVAAAWGSRSRVRARLSQRAKRGSQDEMSEMTAFTNVQASRARPAARSALPHRAQTGHLIRVGNEPRSGAFQQPGRDAGHKNKAPLEGHRPSVLPRPGTDIAAALRRLLFPTQRLVAGNYASHWKPV
jgi:hypothetical protein